MRPETKKLIQEKLHRWLEGEQTHAIDPNGTWINVRDIRSIIDCETELLRETTEKYKKRLGASDCQFCGGSGEFSHDNSDGIAVEGVCTFCNGTGYEPI